MFTRVNLCWKMVVSRSEGLGFSFLTGDGVWVWLRWPNLSAIRRVLMVSFLAPTWLNNSEDSWCDVVSWRRSSGWCSGDEVGGGGAWVGCEKEPKKMKKMSWRGSVS
ncbi:hypothetical protein TorRG33x02_198970 [Trema orientale]|uniref:Uncharacterized protein n=1 Tax=Trema orientale TaxID=63057 RepID=A0A2P5EFN2_TREOI|nr:hypothetical protein TorRG33x02_198970 [Trema orientale]